MRASVDGRAARPSSLSFSWQTFVAVFTTLASALPYRMARAKCSQVQVSTSCTASSTRCGRPGKNGVATLYA